MGFIRGVTLDDHPLRLRESLLTGAARGSAGIPDSLGHKPVDTSGAGVWPAACSWLPRLLLSPSRQLISAIVCLISYCLFLLAPLLWCCPFRPRWPACDMAADLRKPTTTARIERVPVISFRVMANPQRFEKSLENALPKPLRATRGRVIIELSPGKPETTPNTTPGASYVHRMEPVMCYADAITENNGTATAQCYCGWVEYGHTQESADAAAEAHQNRPDDIAADDATESTTAATV
jgi:hypothetical protein